MENIETLFTRAMDESELPAKQKQVLEAALTLFAEKGFDRTNTGDIAKLAGVAEGTVYKRFTTKEALLEAIMKPFIDSVLPTAADEFVTTIGARNEPNFKAFLTYLVQDRLQFVMANRKEMTVFLREAVMRNQVLTALGERFNKLVKERLLALIAQYQARGELVDWDAMRIFRYIVSTLLGYVAPSLLLGTKIDVDQVSQDAIEFLLKGLAPAK